MTECTFVRMMEGEVVHGLLVGNDAGVFTTRQYIDGWLKWMGNHYGPPPDDFEFTEEEARRQLQAIPLLKEVRPHVWLYQPPFLQELHHEQETRAEANE